MKNNPIQFAVVREDPLIESTIIAKTGAENILLIGSGGCTALTLQASFPHASFTLLEPNGAQISLIKKKIARLESGSASSRRETFNIDCDAQNGLNACGNFESLFRNFRRFLNEFVISDDELRDLFHALPNLNLLRQLFDSRYWSVAFDLHFSNSFLDAMFGSAAVQHAPPGTYPVYFRRIFESGLLDSAMTKNYFLHHVFLGCYLDNPESLPGYLTTGVPRYRFSFVECTAEQMTGWGAFDLVDLSNIFDWMPEASVESLAKLMSKEMRSGSKLLFRQLNHAKDFTRFFRGEFRFDEALGETMRQRDRSLFYSKINVGTKV